MALTSRCTACHGTKKVKSLGTMMIDCHACKGVGYVKIEAVLKCDDEPVKRTRKSNKEKVEA